MLGDLGFWGLLIGIVLGLCGIYATLKHSNRKTASIWYKNSVLLAESGSILPEEVTIQFAGKLISHLKKMNIVFWNAGNVTIDENDIVREDPLRIALEGEIDVFKVSVAAQSNTANGANVYEFDPIEKAVKVEFTFFDPGQGLNLEVLYQGELFRPVFHGTIKGIPQGFIDVEKNVNSFFYKAVLEDRAFINFFAFMFAFMATLFIYWAREWIFDEQYVLKEVTGLFDDPKTFLSLVLSLFAIHTVVLYLLKALWRRKFFPPDHLMV